MDVWYLSGWVTLFQFICGLVYAPLAAKMTNLPIHQIPSVCVMFALYAAPD